MKTKDHTNQILESKGIVLFDGYCNLCSWSVQFIIKRDRKDYFRFASLQSNIGQDLLKQFNLPADLEQSVVLLENSSIFLKSDAVLGIVRKLKRSWNYLYYLIYFPKFLRDAIYDLIARNRFSWFGKKDNCFLPEKDISYKFL
ncbi:MAG: hypothetical protein C0597_04880 [Marinilabiliales bacterium]|nr:MAG: hypothetical protein C0597_04880 [Marinilabiliales bacterium]